MSLTPAQEQRIENIERSIALMRRILLGPDEEVLRVTEPGLVRVVFDLHEADKRKRAINKFLVSVASFLGVTNIAGIIFLITYILSRT